MYVPTAFQETDRGKLYDFIEGNSFGLLVSTLGGEPYATHLPLLLDRESSRLLGHVARANPQWRELEGREVLAVFSGPHAYVSPTWYEADGVVPTWNYVAVHAYGTCRLVEDRDGLTQILRASAATYERSMPKPWSVDAGADYFLKLVRSIVGFRIDVGRLEGKWKLNQNHPRERREKVVRALEKSGDPDAREIARLMAEMLHQE